MFLALIPKQQVSYSNVIVILNICCNMKGSNFTSDSVSQCHGFNFSRNNSLCNHSHSHSHRRKASSKFASLSYGSHRLGVGVGARDSCLSASPFITLRAKPSLLLPNPCFGSPPVNQQHFLLTDYDNDETDATP